MHELKWSPVFEVGVDKIDADHRRLFAMANEIREAIVNGDRNTRATLVRAFLEAAERHFADEEEYLRRVGYSDVAQRENLHAALLANATELEKQCEEGMAGSDVDEYYGDLLAFVIDEVVSADHRFKSYLEHKGLTKSRSPGF